MPGEKLDITKEEMERLSEALKKEEFRKLLMEYAEELQDPETRKVYEEELTMLESQRGVDMKFIKPEPGFVLKTQDEKGAKVFVNICSSPHVGVPEFQYAEQTGEGGKVERGQQCSLPYSLSPVHEERDNKDVQCLVYDVVYHPDTLARCSHPKFKELVISTALEGVNSNFKLKLRSDNVKFPKMKFKGTPQQCVIRKRVEEEKPGAFDHLPKRPEFPDVPGERKKDEKESAKKGKQKEDVKKKPEDEPEYEIVFRDNMDMGNFTNDRIAAGVVPSQTVVKISLPLHPNARDVDLDVYPDSLELHSKHYNLTIKLPYKVDSDNGKAKFDKEQRKLSVTLDVVPQEVPKELASAGPASLVQELPKQSGSDTVPDSNSTTNSDLVSTIPSSEVTGATTLSSEVTAATTEDLTTVTTTSPYDSTSNEKKCEVIETTIDTRSETETPQTDEPDISSTDIESDTLTPIDVISETKTTDDVIAESIAECMADVSDATSSDLSEPSIIDIPCTTEIPSSDSTIFEGGDMMPEGEDHRSSAPMISCDVTESRTYEAPELPDLTSQSDVISDEEISGVSPQKPITILKPSDITVKLSPELTPASPTMRSRFNISPVPCNENTCYSADPISCDGHAACSGYDKAAAKSSDEILSETSGLSSYTDTSLEDNLNVSVRVYQDVSTATVILDSIYNSVPEVTISGKKVWLENEDMSLYLIVPHTITTHTISMNAENVCLVLYKQHKSQWASIHIGHHEEEVFSFKFITEENADKEVEGFGDPWVDISPVLVTPTIEVGDAETLISYTATAKPGSLNLMPNGEGGLSTNDEDDDECLIKGILKSPNSPPPQSPRSRKVSFNEEVETFVLPSKRSIKGKKRRKKNASNSGSSASESSDDATTPPTRDSPIKQKAASETGVSASVSEGSNGEGTSTEGLILESAENGWSTVTHKKKNKGKKSPTGASSPPPTEDKPVLQTQAEVVKMIDPMGKMGHKMMLGNSHIYDLED